VRAAASAKDLNAAAGAHEQSSNITKKFASAANNKLAAAAVFGGLKERVKNKEGGAGEGNKSVAVAKSKFGATHSFAESETIAFTRHINETLDGDPDCAHLLPMSEDSTEIFETVKDGVLLCKLINHVGTGDTIDMRCVHLGRSHPLSVFEVTENLNLAINAAVAIGCRVVNIGSGDIMMGSPHLVLGLLWQVVKVSIMQSLNLKATPELIQLLDQHLLDSPDALRELMGLPPEKILLKWINYQLQKDGSWGPTEVKNFGKDLKDSTVYAALLTAVAPADKKPRTLLADVRSEMNPTARANLIIDAAESLGVTQFKILPGDIVKGNEKLNMGFMAAIFNALPGLDPKSTDDDAAKLLAENLKEEIEMSREERAFRMWINSLGLDQFVNDLATEMRDGLLLLHVMNQIKPGCVDWSKVMLKPRNVYHKVANCNYAVNLGKDRKQFGLSLVGIAGKDISDGNLKLTLALTWQLMRFHVIQFLSNLSGMSKGGELLTEADVVEWANDLVTSSSPGVGEIKSLKDGSLGSGVFLLELIKAIEPRAVDSEQVTPGSTPKEKELNAKYAISCARKLGCMVFLLHDDIVEVKPKMLLVMVATLMSYAVNKSAEDSPMRTMSMRKASSKNVLSPSRK